MRALASPLEQRQSSTAADEPVRNLQPASGGSLERGCLCRSDSRRNRPSRTAWILGTGVNAATFGVVSPVDVVVVSYNSADHLRACVEPLVPLDGVRVIVVDNASTDESVASLEGVPATVIPLADNRGFAYGCNVGCKAGGAPFVLFLNPDATIDGDSLALLASTLEADESVGAAGPRIVEADGSLDYSQRRFPRLRSTYAQALFLHRFFPRAEWSDELIRDPSAYERPGDPDWLSGACLLVRRTALELVNGLDEAFFLYSEDIDLCRRLRNAGLEVRFVPGALCVHAGGASAPRAALLPVLAESRVRYAQKHMSRTAALLQRLGIALGAFTHSVVTVRGRSARAGHLRAMRRALTRRSRRAAGP